jgi:hypothetical protein
MICELLRMPTSTAMMGEFFFVASQKWLRMIPVIWVISAHVLLENPRAMNDPQKPL